MPVVLADLPDALFREVIEWIVSALDAWPSNRRDVGRPAMKDICAATCVSSLWRAEVEDACKRMLDRVWLTYVPLDRNYEVWGDWSTCRLPWRACIALGFHEVYARAHQLQQLGAGLVILGCAAAKNGSARREAKCMADVLTQQAGDHIMPGSFHYRVGMRSTTWVNILNPGGFDPTPVLEVKQLTDLPPPLHVEDMESDILCAEIPAGHSMTPSGLDGLMERVISDEILNAPWYLPTGVRTAIRLGPRPALPTAGPIVVVQTSASSDTPMGMPQPQTAIELLAEDGRALGRATIRYSTGDSTGDSTGGASARPGPMLCSFRIAVAAGADASLVEAATLADAPEHPETRAALAALRRETDADTASQRNLLAARVLLFRGVDAFLNSCVDPHVGATWWLRAAPGVVSAHQPFLRWRGLRPVRGWWCLFLANKDDPRDLSIEPSYVDAHEDARDEEMLAARRAIKEAEAARPRDRTRVFEACEACEEIRVRKQTEREIRAALEVASIPFEAEQQAFASDESSSSR